jgi:N-carbamoyl-L-amino-acid hydrolase
MNDQAAIIARPSGPDTALRINGQRLWARLAQMAEIGATPAGGCNRQALTAQDLEARALFTRWCREAGCTIELDAIGNLFAHYGTAEVGLPVILTGSHLDTQPTGGRFDGVYGVLAGLEVVQTLHERGINPAMPIEIVVWTNEEGARFSPGCVGSSVVCGDMTLAAAYALTDANGVRLGDELDRHGQIGSRSLTLPPVHAAFELHIEQGPILEQEQRQIGVVDGVIGLIWYDLVLLGKEAHAGPTPMESRIDPWRAALPILEGAYAIVADFAPWGRCTIGQAKVSPGSRNTVPGCLTIGIDLRHTDPVTLAEIDRQFRTLVAEVCQDRSIAYELNQVWDMPPTRFAQACVTSIERAVASFGYTHLSLFSGAGHDSVYLAKVAPTAMIFIPCEGGLSHNEAENVRSEDVEAGANVLLHAILDAMKSPEEGTAQ